MTVFIYGLRCPLSGHIRYIGKTDDLRRRYRAHLSCRNPRHPKDKWISSLAAKGSAPVLVTLRELDDSSDWAAVEREEIAKATALGWPIFNCTTGGEGAPLTEDQRLRKTERMRDPETRRRMSEAAKARWADPEKRAAALRANANPEKRARLSEAALQRATPEYRAMMSASSASAWADQEKRARIEAGITPEVRERVSKASRRFWASSPKADICRSNLRSRQARGPRKGT